MSDNPIVFIDSGVGGLPYLDEARKILPFEKFVYVADNENFPYGEKDVHDLQNIIINLIQRITDRLNPKLVVIACNTASVVALSVLRAKFGIPFVGVVPAIKPAGEYAVNGRIGLLATRKTVDDPYTDTLIDQFASSCRVEKHAGIELVDFVERDFMTATEEMKIQVISEISEYFSQSRIDALVLGCTHFVYLKDYFKRYLGEKVDVIDSTEGVTRQIKRIVDSESASPGIKKQDTFMITGTKFDESHYLQFADYFQLSWGGIL